MWKWPIFSASCWRHFSRHKQLQWLPPALCNALGHSLPFFTFKSLISELQSVSHRSLAASGVFAESSEREFLTLFSTKAAVPGSQQMSGYWADWSCLIIRAWHPLKHELSNDDEFSSLLWFCECRSYSIRTVKHTAIVFRHIVAEGPQPHALLNAYLWAQYPKNLFMSPRFCQLFIQAAQPNTSVLLPEPIFLPGRSLQFFHSSTVLKQSWENPSLKTQVCFFFFNLCVSLNAGVRACILYVQCVNKISFRTAKL